MVLKQVSFNMGLLLFNANNVAGFSKVGCVNISAEMLPGCFHKAKRHCHCIIIRGFPILKKSIQIALNTSHS